MKFISVKEFKSRSGKAWKALADEKDVVLTNNGRPVAIVSAVQDDNVEESLAALRQARAMQAVQQIQAASVAKGLDKISLEEINAEINAVRRERRH